MIKDIVIFDLDGTLADGAHRLHHILKEKKDWKSFFEACDKDEPIHDTVCLLKELSGSPFFDTWIVSGRSDSVEKKTRSWLHKHRIFFDKLIMRNADDHTDDHILKISWLHDGTIPKERVLCVFEDRARVVDAWRAEGLTCYHVAKGDF